MPVPKRKRSHARKYKRNANKGFSIKAFSNCPNCKEVVAPHQVCKECGFYKGVKILVTKAERALSRGQSRKEKAAQAQQQEPTAAPAESKE